MQGWGKPKIAAKYSGVGDRTLRKWLGMGLPHVRLPSGTILVKFEEIDRFLNQFEVSENRVDKIVSEVEKELNI